MAIITISRGSYVKGREISEKVAKNLGYECISREVILEASDRFNIPEIKMIKAIHDAPSILERVSHGKTAFIAFYQYALSRSVQKDNIVYHGLAGHLLLKGIPHLLKVRISADLSARVANEMAESGIPEREARNLILKDDEERRNWTKNLYGVDPWDSSLYDLTLCIDKFTVDDAVDFICRAASFEKFKATKESTQKMHDLVLACEVKAELVENEFDVAVTSEYQNVIIYTKAGGRTLKKLEQKASLLAEKIPNINNVEVHAGIAYPQNAI
ncbi:MAG: cytidylate kinase-like family protein [Proteobacteria bacterium]|nr:cytidylate kinase-like family protein [Pseudomonadota bacterium]MBU4470218.1 cytidylate kinase-like family protein [Pseudomonadota bacterium]MCG2752634.1 cytidylate kinase-like family protein [Desulfobacteraceae bacterium]